MHTQGAGPERSLSVVGGRPRPDRSAATRFLPSSVAPLASRRSIAPPGHLRHFLDGTAHPFDGLPECLLLSRRGGLVCRRRDKAVKRPCRPSPDRAHITPRRSKARNFPLVRALGSTRQAVPHGGAGPRGCMNAVTPTGKSNRSLAAILHPSDRDQQDINHTPSMRVAMLLAASGFVLLLAGWTGEAAVPTPPECSPADTQQEAILTTGVFALGRPGYARFCGPGRAVVRLGGESFTIQGGRCGGPLSSPRWYYFGLFARGSAPGARGFSVVLEPGDRSGPVKVIDSIVQLAGRNLAPTGTAIVAKGLKSATFTLVTRGPARTRVTGSWTCD
jgi:hypothetical protein